MFLTLNNKTANNIVVASEDEGGWVEALRPNEPEVISRPGSDVIIIGDKPDVIDNIRQGLRTLSTLVLNLLAALVDRRSRGGVAPEPLEVEITNKGSRPVRVILGDGVTDYELASDETYLASAAGYIELRELGLVNMPDQPEAP